MYKNPKQPLLDGGDAAATGATQVTYSGGDGERKFRFYKNQYYQHEISGFHFDELEVEKNNFDVLTKISNKSGKDDGKYEIDDADRKHPKIDPMQHEDEEKLKEDRKTKLNYKEKRKEIYDFQKNDDITIQ